MNVYGSLADDFYINLNLNTEMKLPDARETILDFFGRVQKSYPSMRNFYTRENGDFVLEEDKDQGHQRWISLEPRRICSGCINPQNIADSISQHQLVLQLVPYMLTVSPLDCEALDFMLGFDFNYRGNHDALVAEALGTGHALEPLMETAGGHVLNYEPSLTLALDESCRTQARLMIETRTNAYQVRRGDFPEDQITVYFTLRQYGSLSTETSFEAAFANLVSHSEDLMERYVIGNVLRPLAQAIAAR
ncbi:MAG: hypothetical protein KDA79_13935 [Planctomycetaceae bacterium]|nr:hypothetical protein [Planctomycetaceae bacterium]